MNQHSNSSDERVVAKAIADFFKLFPQGRAAPQEEFDRARAYAELLSRYSVRSVRIALERIGRRGEAFAPSAPQIAAECEKIAVEYRSTDVRAIPRLAAPASAKTNPERMKAGFAKLIEELRASRDPLVPRAKPAIEAALDPQPFPELSERLRATIKPATKTIETEEDLTQCLR